MAVALRALLARQGKAGQLGSLTASKERLGLQTAQRIKPEPLISSQWREVRELTARKKKKAGRERESGD
jgi:conjugal transfer/entry exclusion protein